VSEQVADTIERDIFIRAGIDHVWSFVSRTGFWVGEEVRFDLDAAEGETVVIETNRFGTFPVKVERLDPPRYAAYRWASGYPGAYPDETNSTLVEFWLAEDGDGVTVRLRESGFASLVGAADFRRQQRDDNVEGWAMQLDALRRAAEAGHTP